MASRRPLKSFQSHGRWLLAAVFGLACCTVPIHAAEYQNATEAFNVGAAFYNSRNYAAAQEPFEAALKLTNDERMKLRTYRALMASYRLLPEPDKMYEAAEYVITNSKQAAERSLTRRSLLSFIHQRGKTDEAIKRYEDRLKEKPDDFTSLFLLSEIYARLKQDPERSAELVERLAALKLDEGEPVDVRTQASLAQQYVRARKYEEGAALYETIAPQDEALAAWHYKEAAAAWLKAGNEEKALAAARKSAESEPEKRSELLTYFWHRGLADVFLDAGEPAAAIPHFEKAIENTKIEGYLKSSRERLDEARKQAE
ncbi:Tetratricopeptide repeat protein [Maioricimonas rarisocia]|uniref:Tetratricopeptide repeat protein n=1 Tax=Maioricimonas rarisocia TaxID=2528026 RepID=A0A517Z9E5_9PLAN|nr:tetratricopeptide repeat protein [Maioricimonas rarisocia]QDU39102.1 Tetratricopeptide repeat protein [Maioricimonas rarisocia]